MTRRNRRTAKPAKAAAAQPNTVRAKPVAIRSPLKRWLFRLAAVSLSFLLLLLAEGLLTVFGYGRDLHLIIPAPGSAELGNMQLNEEADWPYFGMIRLAGPEPRRFQVPKPKDTLRIIVVGESTVHGFPYPPELSFPRHMEVLLQRQWPDRKIEVLNAGIIALNSFAIADLVRQLPAAQPDLLVVHIGHNEFYGPGGAGSSTLAVPPSVYPWLVWLRSRKLSQLCFGWWIDRQDRGQELMETLPHTTHIPLDGPLYQRVTRCFRENLTRIVETAQSHHIPVLLTTVASNERDQGPISIEPPAGLSSQDLTRWQQLLRTGEASAAAGQWNDALQNYAAAEQIAADSAVLTFRKAQALAALGRAEEADSALQLARDQDGCRFRAPSAFAEVVRQVAESAGGNSVTLLDTAAELRRRAGADGLGHKLFVEHVHYNFRGHFELAQVIAEFVQTDVLGAKWDAAQLPSQAEMEQQLDAIPQDHLAALSFALQILSTPPMNGALDREQHQKVLADELAARFRALSPRDQQIFADLSMEQISTELLLTLGVRLLEQNRPGEAVAILQKNARRRSWSAQAHLALAQCHLAIGNASAAAASLKTAEDLGADSHAVQAVRSPLRH